MAFDNRASGELRLRHDFRPGRLMHRGVRGVRDPWLLVDHRQPPAALPCACEMIEPGHRAIVDVESETLVRLMTERQPDRRLDRAAMGDGDDVVAGLFAVDALDRAAHA